MSAAGGESNDETRNGGGAPIRELLAAVDGHIGDTLLRTRFGDLGAAFSAALGSWVEPFATAMQGREPTAHSRAAARAMTDVARLSGDFARLAARRLSVEGWDGKGSGDAGSHAELVARIDDLFRDFASSAEFDRARRCAAAAILDWLEQDRAAAASIVRVLESAPARAQGSGTGSTREGRVVVMRDGNATLVRCSTARAHRASVVVVPGFATGAEIFDLDPERSVARTFGANGVETWLLDWGRADESDRVRGVANQLERIDRAVDAARRAGNGRCPALAGHFHGGLLALLYCIRYPGRVRALVTLSTPVEFASPGDVFADWLRACDGERLVDVLGNVPGRLVAAMVAAVSPMGWFGGGFLDLLGAMDSGSGAAAHGAVRAGSTISARIPGETFRALYRALYRDNSFAVNGSAVIDGCRYDLAALATPLLNVHARDDRVVPPGASLPLERWAEAAAVSGRDWRCGHFGLLTGKAAHEELLPEIAAWLTERAEVRRQGIET